MGEKSRGNFSTGGRNLTDTEWSKIFMSDALTDIENGTYFIKEAQKSEENAIENIRSRERVNPVYNRQAEIDKKNEQIIDKVINNSDMYEFRDTEIAANETVQKMIRIMNAFSAIGLPVTRDTAFEFLKALELENIVIIDK